ncbi:hypothetical protein F5Y09DRAFT_201667 [Xylaria sp. FL1042]|nr:hypothetical protein F5Y09DRAFT_201667 [Xylaria sp. FL1042]
MTTDVQRPDISSRGEQSGGPSKRKRADTSNGMEPITTNNKRQRLTKIMRPYSPFDAKILSAVDARYEVELQSVISSSKIRQRVTTMLRHLAAPPTKPSVEQESNTTTSKSKIALLRAKAPEIRKLISIAEIAKREIEKERPASDGAVGETGQEDGRGRWYQYIALGEELEQKERDEGNTVIEETVLGGPDTDARDDEREEDDDDNEFEVMKTPFERAIQDKALVRAVPVMSLFLSRSPVEELKKRYGEQTNAPPM